MSKRYGVGIDNAQLKKPRLDISKTNKLSTVKEEITSIDNDDVWGEDFAEEELEELDIIVSQACSQEVNVSTVNINFPESSRQTRQDNIFAMPSTSSGNYTSSYIMPTKPNNNIATSKLSRDYQQQRFNNDRRRPVASQKISSSEDMRGIIEDNVDIHEFKKNLMMKGNLNSTFQITQENGENIGESIDVKLRKLEILENDYKKLLNDFTLKEGETIFLRQQLQRTQTKAEKESIEKAKQIEEQANKFRSEINSLYKEKESMKTQFQLQTLQMNNIAERCKILETGSIKFTHPQTANAIDASRNRTVIATPSRTHSSMSKAKMSEISIQTEKINNQLFELKSLIIYYPFKKIPRAIFDSSVVERPIVDIENVEKRGKRIVPILEDEETFRIFENPDIVKPKMTVVNNKILSVEFFQSDIAGIINRTESEINSMEVIVTINKIVATLRELMLNIVSVLRTITTLMNNDNIRDMDDLYFSSFYDMPINHNQTLCEANEWHDKERGIEARRTLGILCYIAKESDYLCEYVAGKSELNIQDDEAYNHYSQQMVRYSEWSKTKRQKYEILEIILQLVTTVGYVRRAHQFTGIICAITKLLETVQNKVEFNNKGLNYIANIFKEIVFSRPLPRCLISMTEMMIEFSQSRIFINNIINQTNKMALSFWKNTLSFSDNACVLEIYIEQLKNFRFDEITMINMTYALMSFADIGFRSEVIPWPCETNNDCSSALLTLVITTLYKCAKINVELMKKSKINHINDKLSQNHDDNFWIRLKNKQFDLLKMGIRFLSYLAKRDPEVIIRSVDVESSFPLFMEYVTSVEGLILHEVEEEALTLIKSTFTLDKPPSPENDTKDGTKLFDIMSSFNEKLVPTPTSGTWFNFNGNRDEYRQMTQMFESKLQL